MPAHFSDLLSSETIEIIAESGGKRFTVHSGILATQLGVDEGGIDFSDWDGDTVGRFFEFLYIGDYRFPEPVPEEGDGGGENGWGGGLDAEHTPDTAQGLESWEGRISGDARVNILLVHAKLYTLAQYRGVEGLRVVALERLRMALRVTNGRMLRETSRAAADVTELLGYVYSNTDPHTSPEEPIRDLVSRFAAANFETLMGQGEMASLLGKGGDFAVELMERMAGRLYGPGEPFGVGELGGVGKKLYSEREMQGWRNRAAASEEKVRKLEADLRRLEPPNAIIQPEVVCAGKMQQLEAINLAEIQVLEERAELLEAKMRDDICLLEALNAEKMHELEATNAEKVQNLEATHAEKIRGLEEKVRQLEASNLKNIEQLQAKMRDELRLLEATNAEKVQQLEDTNAIKMQQLEDTNAAKMQQLKVANAEKIRQLEDTNTEKIRQLEDTNAQKMRQFEDTSAAKIRELEAANREVLYQLEDINTENIRQLEIANIVKIQQLEDKNEEKIRQLEIANMIEIQQLEAANSEETQELQANISRLEAANEKQKAVSVFFRIAFEPAN